MYRFSLSLSVSLERTSPILCSVVESLAICVLGTEPENDLQSHHSVQRFAFHPLLLYRISHPVFAVQTSTECKLLIHWSLGRDLASNCFLGKLSTNPLVLFIYLFPPILTSHLKRYLVFPYPETFWAFEVKLSASYCHPSIQVEVSALSGLLNTYCLFIYLSIFQKCIWYCLSGIFSSLILFILMGL